MIYPKSCSEKCPTFRKCKVKKFIRDGEKFKGCPMRCQMCDRFLTKYTTSKESPHTCVPCVKNLKHSEHDMRFGHTVRWISGISTEKPYPMDLAILNAWHSKECGHQKCFIVGCTNCSLVRTELANILSKRPPK